MLGIDPVARLLDFGRGYPQLFGSALTAFAQSPPMSVVDLELDQCSADKHEPRDHGQKEPPPVPEQRVGRPGLVRDTWHDTAEEAIKPVRRANESPNCP